MFGGTYTIGDNSVLKLLASAPMTHINNVNDRKGVGNAPRYLLHCFQNKT